VFGDKDREAGGRSETSSLGLPSTLLPQDSDSDYDDITNPGYSIGKGSEKLLSSLRTVFNPDRDQFYFTNCVIIFQQHFPRKEHTFCVLTACTDFSLNR